MMEDSMIPLTPATVNLYKKIKARINPFSPADVNSIQKQLSNLHLSQSNNQLDGIISNNYHFITDSGSMLC